MCLKTSCRGRNNPKTDIVCYKVLIHLNGKLFAPFTKYEYKLGEILDDSAEEKVEEKGATKIIGSGYFHACTSLDRIKSLIQNQLNKISPENVFVHKAIIPCKTKYYVDGKGNICAKSIKVLSEVCAL